MNTLFDIAPTLPSGFTYAENFISPEEERALLMAIQKLTLDNMKFHMYEAKRKVISFGKGWSFTDQCLKDGNQFPEEVGFLITRIAGYLKIPAESIAQFLVTEYPVGSVINWHRDAPPFETIVGVLLLSDCIFKLRPQEKEKQTRTSTVILPVKRRSFYVMKGQSKTAWQHCTSPVEKVRYSLTFRTLRII